MQPFDGLLRQSLDARCRRKTPAGMQGQRPAPIQGETLAQLYVACDIQYWVFLTAVDKDKARMR